VVSSSGGGMGLKNRKKVERLERWKEGKWR
jgi:hypothetical protein